MYIKAITPGVVVSSCSMSQTQCPVSGVSLDESRAVLCVCVCVHMCVMVCECVFVKVRGDRKDYRRNDAQARL